MRKLVKNPKEFGRVAVLMGGWSAERQVSIWSGEGVVAALKEKGVDVTAVDADKDAVLNLGKQGYDRVFNIMHGTGGEDGTVQAILDLHGLPYPGSGVLASSLAMDKLRTKRIWKAEGLPTPDFMVLKNAEDAHEAAKRFGYPLIIKPAADGSSVGVSKVKSVDQVDKAFADALGDGRVVIAEEFIAGGEYTCPILDGVALPVIRIEPDGEFYDFNAKYISDKTLYHCPAGLEAPHEKTLQQICAKAFDLIGCKDWGRVDFMMDAQGKPWLLEINTLPGMTSHSLVPMSAKVSGLSYADLCWALLETTLKQ